MLLLLRLAARAHLLSAKLQVAAILNVTHMRVTSACESSAHILCMRVVVCVCMCKADVYTCVRVHS